MLLDNNTKDILIGLLGDTIFATLNRAGRNLEGMCFLYC
jgi:hypothetical protein